MRTCIVLIQNVRICFACTKRFFNLSTQGTINVINESSYVSCGIFPLKIKQFCLSWNLANSLDFRRDEKINSRCFCAMCFVQHAQTRSVFTFQQTKILVFRTVTIAKPALTRCVFPLRTKIRHLCCLVWMVHIGLQKHWVATFKKEIHLSFRGNLSVTHKQAHPNVSQKGQKSFFLWHNRVESPLVDTVKQNLFSFLTFYIFSLQ